MHARIRPGALVALTVVWVLLWGNLSWVNALSGLLVAATVLLLFPLPPLMSRVRVRPWAFVVLVAHFLADLVTASFHVAWLAVRPARVGAGALIDVRLELTDDLQRVVVAELTSLVPGTVVIDVDPDTGVLTIHVLDTTDPARLQRERDSVRALERRVAAALVPVGAPGDVDDPRRGPRDDSGRDHGQEATA